MKHDACQFVGSGCDRLRLAEPSGDAKELAQVIVGVVKRIGSSAQGERKPALYTAAFGEQGMQERAKLAGGKLTVWSELDSGTEIELTIPAALGYVKASPAAQATYGRPFAQE